jgi:hypothetical protein
VCNERIAPIIDLVWEFAIAVRIDPATTLRAEWAILAQSGQIGV